MFLKRQSRFRYGLRVLLLLVAIAGIVMGIYYYGKYNDTRKLLKDPNFSAQKEKENLVAKVGRLIDLPAEDPSIATVSDVTKLQGQPFFAKAKNGYKVLIYQNARKAILYDPKRNKIIEVGPINIGQTASPQPTQPVSTPTPVQEKVKVTIYNGTKTAGMATLVERQLVDKMKDITVLGKTNSKLDYTRTIVIDLSGKNKDTAFDLASQLQGQVGALPKGEVAPSSETDILVIVGK